MKVDNESLRTSQKHLFTFSEQFSQPVSANQFLKTVYGLFLAKCCVYLTRKVTYYERNK